MRYIGIKIVLSKNGAGTTEYHMRKKKKKKKET